MIKKALTAGILVFYMALSAFCPGQEQKESGNQFPEIYFSEGYLAGICALEGIDETVTAIESVSDIKERKSVYARYFKLAGEYETKGEGDNGKKAAEVTISPEDRARYLLIAVNCFDIASRSPVWKLKNEAREGLERCRHKLMSVKPSGAEDKYMMLQRCIDVDADRNSKNREAKLTAYFERAREYEEKANKSVDKESKKEYIEAALNFYSMVNTFTKDKNLQKQANDARTRLVQALSKL